MEHNKIILNIKQLFVPYRKNLIIISIVMMATSLGSFITPWLTKQLIDIGIIAADFSQTTIYAGLIFLVFVIQQLFGVIQFHYYRDISIRIPYDLNEKACKHVLSIRTKYFKDRNFSEVMSELFQDIANISSLTDAHFLASFVNLFKIIAGVSALFLINWQLTLIMIATIPIKILISSILFKKQESIYREVMLAQSNFSAWLGDGISGIVEIKVWGIINKKLSRLRAILEESKQAKSRLMFFGYVDGTIGSTLSICFTCILYILGSLLIQKNEMTIGSLVSFVSYSAFVFEPIGIISHLITQLSIVKPAFERFLKFLNIEAEIDRPGSIEISNSMEIHQIEFENVSLVYDQEKVLDQVSFTINQGEKVGIIGFNGSGKTSIINLLLRFYEPTEGMIKINDTDINSYTFESYRSLWSLMPQNNYLFNDTIKNNINISDDLSINEIVDSCKSSGAYLFIEELPEQYETCVGYNGGKLSGGQKQKIALARTLARKNTRALILDEATSSFDYYSEQLINERIVSSERYSHTIIITHRPELLKKLDKIIYFDKGRVLGIGSFDELYGSLESFRNMIVNTQDMEVVQDHAVHAFSD